MKTNISSIFITGGSGLLALNWAFDINNQYTITLGTHKRKISLGEEGITTYQSSLGTTDAIQSIFDEVEPGLVIHTAGLTNVEACEADPELARYANIELAENIAKSCSSNDVKLVHISTDHLFSGDIMMAEEDQPVNPVNMYGKTKAEAESRVLEIKPDALVIRTNFYGWGPTYRRSFSDMIIDTLRKQQAITLFQDVHYTPILISKLTKAVMSLATQNMNGIFHVVGDERISKYEFGLKVASQFGLDEGLINAGNISDKPNLVKRPIDMSLSNRKICKVLGNGIGDVEDGLVGLSSQRAHESYERITSL